MEENTQKIGLIAEIKQKYQQQLTRRNRLLNEAEDKQQTQTGAQQPPSPSQQVQPQQPSQTQQQSPQQQPLSQQQLEEKAEEIVEIDTSNSIRKESQRPDTIDQDYHMKFDLSDVSIFADIHELICLSEKSLSKLDREKVRS